ncbi:MAG: ferrous iron transport protein A [Gammaproteobacteria bacterium]|nr:ferrous iron transport protein A [Gammaproteobacteria bacterium]
MTDITHSTDSNYSLARARPGDLVRVTCVNADKQLKKRLVSMGVSINSRLHIIQRRGNATVVGFDASRIAIGDGMSQQIMVCAV